MYGVVNSVCGCVFGVLLLVSNVVGGWGEKIFFLHREVKDKTRGTFRRIFRCPDVTELPFLGANFEYPVIDLSCCGEVQELPKLSSFIVVY